MEASIPVSNSGDLRGPIRDLNSIFGHTSMPFNLVMPNVLSGNIKGLPEKQLLFAHYHIFIKGIWKMFMEWQQSLTLGNNFPIGLINPIGKIQALAHDQEIMSGGPNLPNLVELNRTMVPVPSSYIKLLTQEKRYQRAAALSLISLTWRAQVFRWEARHKQGIDKTLSEQGIDLYQQCMNLLIEENVRSIQKSLGEKAARGVAGIYRRGYPLTQIIGAAVTVALEAWDAIDEDSVPIAAMFAATHNSVATQSLNAFIKEYHSSDPTTTVYAILANTVAKIKDDASMIASIQREISAERDSGNSTASPIIAGCPAMGTPAFMGIRSLLLDLKRLVIPQGQWSS